MEVWRDVVGYEGFYQVSDKGRVRSVTRMVKHSSGTGFKKVSGRVLKQNVNCVSGYHTFMAWMFGVSKRLTVHVEVAKLFIPNPLGKLEVNHLKTKVDNGKDDLEWATHTENMIHSFEHGHHPIREKHGQAKVSDEIVDRIVVKFKNGAALTDLANEFDITRDNIYNWCIKGIRRKRYEENAVQ